MVNPRSLSSSMLSSTCDCISRSVRVPVISIIRSASAEPDRVVNEIEDVIGLEAHDAPRISAKTGLNVEEVLEQIVTKIPAPHGDVDAPLKALIFDSIYDAYKGVIVFCRIWMDV